MLARLTGLSCWLLVVGRQMECSGPKIMKHAALSAVLAAALAFPPLESAAQQRTRIQLSQLEAMFSNMRAKAPWNVDGPLLWGYFFFDPDPSKLRQISGELQALGYQFVSIEQVPGRNLFRLHVEKVEIHSPQSLNSRNEEFYQLAEKFGITSYDGMDVGPAPK